jgi:hypothetical protein
VWREYAVADEPAETGLGGSGDEEEGLGGAEGDT